MCTLTSTNYHLPNQTQLNQTKPKKNFNLHQLTFTNQTQLNQTKPKKNFNLHQLSFNKPNQTLTSMNYHLPTKTNQTFFDFDYLVTLKKSFTKTKLTERDN